MQRDVISQSDSVVQLTVEYKGEKFEFSQREIYKCNAGKLVSLELDHNWSLDNYYHIDSKFQEFELADKSIRLFALDEDLVKKNLEVKISGECKVLKESCLDDVKGLMESISHLRPFQGCSIRERAIVVAGKCFIDETGHSFSMFTEKDIKSHIVDTVQVAKTDKLIFTYRKDQMITFFVKTHPCSRKTGVKLRGV